MQERRSAEDFRERKSRPAATCRVGMRWLHVGEDEVRLAQGLAGAVELVAAVPYHNYGPLEGGATTEALCEISRNFRETTAPLRGALPPLTGRCTTFPYRNYGPP